MLGSHRRASATVLGLTIALLLAGQTATHGQAYPGMSYEEALLRRLALTGPTRPSDLADLNRLMLLENISMMNYARIQLGNSPAGLRLRDEIGGLVQTSSAFEQAMSGANVENPQQAFAALAGAYAQVEGDLGSLPGIAPYAAFRLGRMSRLFNEVSEQLGPVQALGTAVPVVTGPYAEIRQEVQTLGRALVSLNNLLKRPDPRSAELAKEMKASADDLVTLLQGFDRFLAGGPSIEDVRLIFYPVRFRAQQVHPLLANRAVPADIRRRWRTIHDGMNDLSDYLGFSRTVVVTPAPLAAQRPASETLVKIDQAITEFEAFRNALLAAAVPPANEQQVQEETSRLRTLLYHFRENFAAGLSKARATPTLRALESANRQLMRRVSSAGKRAQIREVDRLKNVERILKALAPETPARPSS